jgi:hypothetical protein
VPVYGMWFEPGFVRLFLFHSIICFAKIHWGFEYYLER